MKLNEATAVRRTLIAHLRVDISSLDGGDLQLDQEQEQVLAEMIADSLIDAEWVVRDPNFEPQVFGDAS